MDFLGTTFLDCDEVIEGICGMTASAQNCGSKLGRSFVEVPIICQAYTSVVTKANEYKAFVTFG